MRIMTTDGPGYEHCPGYGGGPRSGYCSGRGDGDSDPYGDAEIDPFTIQLLDDPLPISCLRISEIPRLDDS